MACDACGAEHGLLPVLARKTATAYVVVRVVRLLQARGAVPGHSGLTVAGRHVHHYVHGGLLVAASVAAARRACLHRPLRANVLCTGVALMADEFDLLTGTQDRRRTPAVRTALDAVAGVLLVGALRRPRRTLRG